MPSSTRAAPDGSPAMVLVADAECACLYEAKTPTAALHQALTLFDPAAGAQRRAERFAAFVSRRVAGCMARHAVCRLHVVAEPRFLEVLRGSLAHEIGRPPISVGARAGSPATLASADLRRSLPECL